MNYNELSPLKIKFGQTMIMFKTTIQETHALHMHTLFNTT